MGKHALADLSGFRSLLFYQLTSSFLYFDMLIMVDEDMTPFFENEVKYFVEKMEEKSMMSTACMALKM